MMYAHAMSPSAPVPPHPTLTPCPTPCALQDDSVGYGISSTLYDHVFNTMSKHLLKKMA